MKIFTLLIMSLTVSGIAHANLETIERHQLCSSRVKTVAAGLKAWIGIGRPAFGHEESVASYEGGFSRVVTLSGGDGTTGFLKRFLEERRNRGQATHVLDLFASGFFVEDPRLADSITGMRWVHTNSWLAEDRRSTEILGGIFNPETWKALDSSMVRREIPKMDLVTMHPNGKWIKLKLNEEDQVLALQFVMQNVLSRLSDSGRFYFRVPVGAPFRKVHLLRQLRDKIEANSSFRLYLRTPQFGNMTLFLDGALIPKNN